MYSCTWYQIKMSPMNTYYAQTGVLQLDQNVSNEYILQIQYGCIYSCSYSTVHVGEPCSSKAVGSYQLVPSTQGICEILCSYSNRYLLQQVPSQLGTYQRQVHVLVLDPVPTTCRYLRYQIQIQQDPTTRSTSTGRYYQRVASQALLVLQLYLWIYQDITIREKQGDILSLLHAKYISYLPHLSAV